MMSEVRALGPGDQPDFIEGWNDSRNWTGLIEEKFWAIQSLSYLLALSHQAVDRLGESYRGFRVGCAMAAVDDSGGRRGVYFGGNYTPYKGAEWNCAEKRALGSVASRGFNRVVAIAVSGPPYTDETTGVVSKTCTPCNRCRKMFNDSDLASSDLLIATSDLTESEYELHTLGSMSALHENGEPQPFPAFYHPQLASYWDQVLSYDAEDEIRERAMLAGLAEIGQINAKIY